MKKEMQQIVNRDRLCANVHLREAQDGGESRTITGYAIMFNVPSDPMWADDEEEAREVIAPEAITREILDGCDIKMTMFHDRQLILARSKNGEGTLRYNVDEKGVSFEFEAPHTVDGDKALELVKRGDIAGCSFAFSTRYWDGAFVERNVVMNGGRCFITYRVKAVTGVYDFTLAADPCYPDTSVATEAREMQEHAKQLRKQKEAEETEKNEKKMREQVAEMRKIASKEINV